MVVCDFYSVFFWNYEFQAWASFAIVQLTIKFASIFTLAMI